MTVSITRETVTPDMAVEWLGSQHMNRNLRPTVALRYRQAMEGGEWADNGEPIRFNGDGTLIDGQHRLSAIRDTGLSQELWIARGLTEDAQATIDTGSRRSVGDVLHMRGVPNASVVAAALNVIHRYQNNRETTPQSVAVSPRRALEMYAEMGDALQASITPGRRASEARSVLMPGMATALHRIFSDIDSDLADTFFDRLADGAELEKGSPILILRALLERLATERQRAGKRGDKVYVHAVMVKAWNGFREGATYTYNYLRWRRTGKGAEAFPKPQ